MAIVGAHVLLYSSEPEALRATLRDLFQFSSVDAGHGWLIFALPPAEIAVHPVDGPITGGGARHEITLMCDDITATVATLRAKGIVIEGEPKPERWGAHVTMVLPGGVTMMLYEPQHPVAIRRLTLD